MFKYKTHILLKICMVLSLFIIFFYCFLTNDSLRENLTKSERKLDDYNVWLIFTKVAKRSTLKYKFRNLLENLLEVSSVPLKFNIIIDNSSKAIAVKEISDTVATANKTMAYKLYDIEECARKIKDIVDVMTPHFSSKPGTYYSGALFYISLGLYKIAPTDQTRAVLLDCDLYFKKDILLLFKQFESFKSTALFGLAPELTPVYRHILHPYKAKHNTTFGDYYHETNVIRKMPHPRGFQGYNSGVVMINLKALRESTVFERVIANETVEQMTAKYKFRGHLGDQDFYTLAGYEYPDLIQTIDCAFNRQLCTWWRDHGYSDVFDNYFKSNDPPTVSQTGQNMQMMKMLYN